MPIDELDMAELYVQLFPEKQAHTISTENAQTFFQTPGEALIVSVTHFQSLYPAQEDIFKRVAKSFQDQDNADLFSAATKLSKFLGAHHEEITSSIDPEFRVLDYVYPIV